jgi:hypothetical protein
MLKLKGGPGGQTISVQPCEVAEIEGGALVDDIRKLIMPMPFNPPSAVLFQLLGFLVDAGKSVVQTSFEKLSDSNPNMPVGTTVALIEQGMVVFSSIHSRLHASMAKCFSVLHRLNSAYLTEEDIKAQESGLEIEPSDFDGPMDVIPVSDPHIFSETQRFAQVQAIMQRAAVMPQIYDPRKVEELFLRAMKVSPGEVLVPLPASEDMDPVSENVAASMGRPLYVLPKQDHIAHLMAHMAFLKSPLFGSNPAIIKTFIWPISGHLRDHVLNYYLVESHDAVDKAQQDEIIKAEASEQVQIILSVQSIIEQQLAPFVQELAQIDQAAQQYRPQPQMPPDNSLQIAQMNAQIQGEALKQNTATAQGRLQVDQQRLQQQGQIEQVKLAMQKQKNAEDMALEQMKQQQSDKRAAESDASRERMNSSDNETAMLLAAAEIQSGERVAVSTGTGINPQP